MKIYKTVLLSFIIIWMVTIFIFSHQPAKVSSNTSGNTIRFIMNYVPIIKDFNYMQKEEIVELLQPIVRKLAHYTLYTIGGMLIISFIYTLEKSKKEKILYSIAFGVCFVITDEVHQLFVPGRTGRLLDVGIDILGIITGILIFLIIKEMIGAVRNKIQEQK